MLRIPRNSPCWCGSGRKYKYCHMEEDLKLQELERQGCFVMGRDAIKSEDEIEGIRKSGRLTARILDMVQERIKAGVTTEDINQWVHEYTLQNGGIPATLNYEGYPKSVCTSINNVICHGIPDSSVVLKDGDIINVDVTTILDGYYGDASRMYIIGNASENAIRLVNVAKECMEAGIEQVKPYAPLGNIGRAIEPIALKNGFSVVREYCGHGVGLDIHEEPQVDHYAMKEDGVIMAPGMVFTIEPMINEGVWKSEVLDDGWTAVTADGKLSAQWEHTILVTNDGYEILTKL
jgi:methionyl aminopeptidase